MGGGDLNLKKSWHPNTMKNMERVWKAEQKDTEEKKRIAELQREIVAERDKEDMQKFAEDMGVVKKKDDVKLEWMYRGPSQSINREDYLLGKAVDKNFEKYNNEQAAGTSAAQDEESLPGALRQAKSSMFSEQVDVARKLHEDPLMAIRQRAVEKAKQLYNNPVKMKQIQKMAAALEDKNHVKEKKKKKKKSKKCSRKDNDEMLDALLTQKLKTALKDRELLRKFKKRAHESSSDSTSESSDNEGGDESHRHKRKSDEGGSGERGSLLVKDHHTRLNPPTFPRESRGKEQSTNRYEERESKRTSRSPKQYYSRRSCDQSSRRRSRSRSRERLKIHARREETRFSEGRRNYDFGASSSRQEKKIPLENRSRFKDGSQCLVAEDVKFKERYNIKQKSPLDDRRRCKDESASSSTEDMKAKSRYEKGSSYDPAGSGSGCDSDDGARSRKNRAFGLMMADGSKPVVAQKSVVRDHKPQPPPELQKPAPWQKREKVKLSDGEKERRRKEMMENATWRDKEREINVKRYRMEEAHEKRQLQENFDNDFAMKQFSKATDQTSVEGRIKSKLNTIQRSKMAMDQNFARR